MLQKVERVLATLAALLVFTLHELQLFSSRPRVAEAASGFIHSTWVRANGAPEQLFLSWADLAARWSLVALTVSLAVWALADTFGKPAKAAAGQGRSPS